MRMGRARKLPRRGRQEEAPPADAAEGGEGGDEVPEWCDPTTNMGAWLNYKQIRAICGERGFEDFGPYGGIPTEEEGGEEGAEEARQEHLKIQAER